MLPLSSRDEGISDEGDLRVISRALTVSNQRTPEAFGPPGEEFVADVVGFVQYAKPKSTRLAHRSAAFASSSASA